MLGLLLAPETEQSKKRQERVKQFLDIFNGDWRKPHIKHHCSVYCRCGGQPLEKVAEMASSLFLEIILSGKPKIPALNRWLRCAETSTWFMSLG